MKKVSAIFVIITSMIITMPSWASFMDVVNTIHATGNAINSVNRATRGTMSTIEYGQRFQDRQQERKDYKQAQSDYNNSIEDEYYKTIQQTKSLEAQYNQNNTLRVDL